MSKSTDLFGVLDSEYEIVRELGHGGASVVYLGRDRELERDVAIKIIDDGHAADPEAQARFQREARTLAQLHHPNIVQLYRAKRLPDGRLALIMQHMAGPSLRDVLLHEGALPWERAQQILSDIADALAFLHQRGIVHRDVKPENIYIEPEDGRALLADFGIAKSTDSNGASGVTVTGAVIGTPAYMSPEQVDGNAVDGRSDVYSLGLTAHEMLSGVKPWAGEGIYAIIYKQKNEELPSLASLRPELPFHLVRAVERCLAKDRDERWPSARELLDHLQGGAVLPAEVPVESSSLARLAPVDIEPHREDDLPMELQARRESRWRMPRGAAILLLCLIGAAALANAIPREGTPTGDAAALAADAARNVTPAAGAPAPEALPGQTVAELDFAADSLPVARPEATLRAPSGEGASESLIRDLSGRIQQLERRLVARMDSARQPTTTPATVRTATDSDAAAAARRVETPPTVPDRLVGRPVESAPAAVPAATSVVAPAASDEGSESAAEISMPVADSRPVTPPQLLNRTTIADMVRDAYPAALERRGTVGTVLVRLLVDVNGRVTDRTVVESGGDARFDQAALTLAGSMRFRPARIGGAVVPRWVEMPIQFVPPPR